MIGGQVGMVGHINIGDGVKIGAQSGISKSLEPGKSVWGSPAFDYASVLRSLAVYRNLPGLEKRVRELELLIKQLLKEKV
jgi:UDP-3-O-[3-hydroxymyristoyl] glucosamine N-acyltransferase